MRESNMEQLTETTERLEVLAEDLERSVESLEQRLAARIEACLEASLATNFGEQMASQIAATQQAAQESIAKITATIDPEREAELERRLMEAEARIAELTAAAATQTRAAELQTPNNIGRKTVPAGMAAMLAKQGVVLEASHSGLGIEAAALDTALASLSIEQRIAVKSELLRAGLMG